MALARPRLCRLPLQRMRRALSLAPASAGRSMLARMAMMAITTNNSIRVKAVILPTRRLFMVLVLLPAFSCPDSFGYANTSFDDGGKANTQSFLRKFEDFISYAEYRAATS